jgi:hypothetical protein
MLRIPLLLIGTAFDGPDNEFYRFQNREKLLNTFGSYAWESYTVVASTTSIILSSAPWNGTVDVYEYITSEYKPYYLYNSSVSGNVLSFGRPGETKTIYIKYLRPHGISNLVKGCLEALTSSPPAVYLLRLGGTKATTQIGSGDSIVTVSAKYSGSLYNNMTFTIDGTTLTITPPPGLYKTCTYTIGLPEDLDYEINLDAAKGYIPVTSTYYGTSTLAPVVSSLTVGTTGDMSVSGVIDLLDTIDLYGVDVVSVLGTYYEDIKNDISRTFFDNIGYPVSFVQNATPKLSSVSNADYINSASSGIIDMKEVSVVASECYYEVFPGVSYWGPASTAYAGLFATDAFSTTHLPFNIVDFTPRFSTSNLSSLSNNGLVVINNTISVGPAVHYGISTDTTWNATCVKVYQNIVRELYDALEPLIGNNNYTFNQIDDLVDNTLSNIPTLFNYNYQIELTTYAINIDIVATVVGEVRAISFQVGVSTNATTFERV